MKNDSYLFLWDRISKIVRNYTKGMEVVADEPGNLRVEANNGRPFVCVSIQKKHVGIYLLPLYYHPETLPHTLYKNKSGKSTLRFKSKEEFSVKDIERLIENCLAVIGHY